MRKRYTAAATSVGGDLRPQRRPRAADLLARRSPLRRGQARKRICDPGAQCRQRSNPRGNERRRRQRHQRRHRFAAADRLRPHALRERRYRRGRKSMSRTAAFYFTALPEQLCGADGPTRQCRRDRRGVVSRARATDRARTVPPPGCGAGRGAFGAGSGTGREQSSRRECRHRCGGRGRRRAPGDRPWAQRSFLRELHVVRAGERHAGRDAGHLLRFLREPARAGRSRCRAGAGSIASQSISRSGPLRSRPAGRNSHARTLACHRMGRLAYWAAHAHIRANERRRADACVRRRRPGGVRLRSTLATRAACTVTCCGSAGRAALPTNSSRTYG